MLAAEGAGAALTNLHEYSGRDLFIGGVLSRLLRSLYGAISAQAGVKNEHPAADRGIHGNGHIKLIIPLPPGTGTDIAGRLLAERLAERWGQPVVVENQQGGDGIPAVTAFLAARDTHTLLLSFAGLISINPLMHERLPYDPALRPNSARPVSDNFLGVAASRR